MELCKLLFVWGNLQIVQILLQDSRIDYAVYNTRRESLKELLVAIYSVYTRNTVVNDFLGKEDITVDHLEKQMECFEELSQHLRAHCTEKNGRECFDLCTLYYSSHK